MGIVRRFTPTDLYDIDGCQNWLDEMASRGLFLQKWGRYWSVFKQGDPDPNMRYRLEPVRPGITRREYQDMKRGFLDQGWRYVTTAQEQFYIFRAVDPFAPEIETRADRTAAAVKGMQKEALKSLLFRIGILLVSALILFLQTGSVPGIHSMLALWGPLTPFLLILIPAVLVLSFYPFFPLMQVSRDLRDDEELPRSSPRRRVLILAARWGAIVILVLTLLESGFMHVYQGRQQLANPADLEFTVLSLEELEDNPSFIQEPFSEEVNYLEGDPRGTYAVFSPSFWAPTHFVIRQSGTGAGQLWSDVSPGAPYDGIYSPSLTIEFWETRGDFGAQKMYDELVKADYGSAQDRSLNLNWVDSSRLFYTDYRQDLMLNLGDRVLAVTYIGTGDITQYTHILRSMLKADYRPGLLGTITGLLPG